MRIAHPSKGPFTGIQPLKPLPLSNTTNIHSRATFAAIRHRTLHPIAASHALSFKSNGNPNYDEAGPAFQIPKSATLPSPLPPSPKSATLLEVMPYLAKLALGESNLYWRLGAALTLLIFSKATGVLAPIYFKQAVDALSSSGTAQAMMKAAVAALLLSGACRAASGLSKELQHPLFTPVSQAAGRRVSFYVLAHVLGLDMQFHLDRQTGALSRMLERGARSIAMIFRAVVFTMVPTLLELVAVCALLARAFHPKVSLLVVATFVVYSTWTVWLTLAATRVRREVKDLDNAITSRAVDALLNVEAVKLCGNEQLEVELYDQSLVRYQGASVRLEGTSAMLNAGQAVVLAAGMTAALAAAASTRGVTPGDLVMIQGLLLQLWAPLQFLGWFYRELRQSLVDMEDLFELMRMQTSVPDGAKNLPDVSITSSSSSNGVSSKSYSDTTNKKADGRRDPYQTVYQQIEEQQERLESGKAASTSSHMSEGLKKEDKVVAEGHHHHASSSAELQGLRVELKNVRYKYPNTTREVLRGVTITAEPGQSIAVVGPSGSGKSTLLRLLVRMFDVDDGAVLLNGVDVRELKYEALRSSTAVVPQDTVLFNDTLLHNVAFGRPDASFQEVRDAIVAAKLDSAMERMPNDWNTLVGERGLKLSGGERQRLSIARAFLRKPRLLICDEATSALDTATERGIMASLEELAVGRTSVFVAHRLSTIQGCDAIYVLRDGKVEEVGTHSELMLKRGVYYDMWQMQRAQEELETHLMSMADDDEEENGVHSVQNGKGKNGNRDEDDEADSSDSDSNSVEPRNTMDVI